MKYYIKDKLFIFINAIFIRLFIQFLKLNKNE